MNISPSHPTASNEFVITRFLHAARALVWQAWTEPHYLKRWWGPHGFEIPECELDVQEGGRYRIVMRSADRVNYPVQGIFSEVDPIERLVMTVDCSEHPPAWHDRVRPHRAQGDKNPAGVMLQTVTFENLGEATQLRIQTRFETPAARDALLKIGMLQGWSQSLEQLDALVISESGAADRHLRVSRLIDAPRERVFDAWTDPTQLLHWWGSNGFKTTHVSLDAREGGMWSFTMQGPDGTVYPNKVVYTEVVAPERLVYAHNSDDLPKNSLHFRSTASFAEYGDKTLLTLYLLFPSAVERDRAQREFSAADGARQMLDRLQDYLARTMANGRGPLPQP